MYDEDQDEEEGGEEEDALEICPVCDFVCPNCGCCRCQGCGPCPGGCCGTKCDCGCYCEAGEEYAGPFDEWECEEDFEPADDGGWDED